MSCATDWRRCSAVFEVLVASDTAAMIAAPSTQSRMMSPISRRIARPLPRRLRWGGAAERRRGAP